MAVKGRRRQKADPPRRGMAAAAIDQAIANPMGTVGGLTMAVVAGAILVNALLMQPGPHPAPLFAGISPLLEESRVPTAVAPGEDRIGELLGGRPAADPRLVADIQEALGALGFYTGAVDGLEGPMTSDAIERFQSSHGLDVDGVPTADLLTILDVAVPHADGTTDPAPAAPAASVEDAVPPPPAAAAPAPPAAVPLPRPSPLRKAAAAEPAAPSAEAVASAAAATPARPAAHAAETAGRAPVRLPKAATPVAYAPDAEPAPARAAAPEAPQADPRLARVQEALDLAGYGPLQPSGLWTAETGDAIRRFEKNRGLAITGRINEAFLAELIKIGGLAGN